MNDKKNWGFAFLVVVALVYLVPRYLFIQTPQETITEIYFADRITEAHRILIDRYNAEYAGSIRVVPIDFANPDFSTNDRKEVLARSLRGEDEGIDLLAVDVIWVQRFAKWCEPLGKYFTDAERNRLMLDGLRSCYYEGELVAVPLDLVQGVLFYREDLLSATPAGRAGIEKLRRNITWPEFLRLQTAISSPGPFFVYPAADYEGLICIYIEVLLGLEPDYFTVHGFDLNTASARKSLQLLVDLVHRYRATPDTVADFTEVSSYEYFIRNNGLFIRGWTSYSKDFAGMPYDASRERHLRAAPIPVMAGGHPSSVFGGWNLMVARSSTKKEAVVDFVKYLLSDSSQEVFYARGGHFPVIRSFYTDSVYRAKYPEIDGINRLMATGRHRPHQEGYTKYSKIMSRYFSLAIAGKIAVDEALDNATQAIAAEKSLVEVH